MYIDPIVQEIHLIREEHCQRFHGDIHQIFLDVKKREQQHAEKVVNLLVKKKQTLNASMNPK
jgi:hypothetical protein